MRSKHLLGELLMKLFDDVTRFLINIKQPLSDDRRNMMQLEAADVELSDETIPSNTIVCNGIPVEIKWDKVVKHTDVEGMVLPENCYKTVKNQRIPTMFVAHWDVCLSSKSCFNVLKKRKLSVHFLIDNDGTIHQIMDTNHIAYHAGNRKVNNASVGVEISNAYYPKYQNIYKKRGFGPRPLWEGVKVHGRELEPFLGFYDVQVEAFKALSEALNKGYNIPLQSPVRNGQPVETIYNEAKNATFKGVVNHYHITTRKIDCAGLNLDEVLK